MKQFSSFLSFIFLTNDKSRPRAGWRILIVGFLTVQLFNIVNAFSGPTSGYGDAVIVSTTIFLTRHFVDKRSIASLGLRLNKQTVLDLLAGFGISFLLMTAVFVIEYALGWIKFESFAWQNEPPSAVVWQTLDYTVGHTVGAYKEELVDRGYMLQTIASGLNLPLAALITSIGFGIGHMANPNSSWLAAMGITFLALLNVYGYVRTRQLWLPIGLHAGWNIFQRSFGFPVSGYELSGLLKINVSGPELWTGGAFGPEAGLIILPICGLGAVLVHLFTRQREGVADPEIEHHPTQQPARLA
jgi:membrane protease YdiL (CAAX protease family)